MVMNLPHVMNWPVGQTGYLRMAAILVLHLPGVKRLNLATQPHYFKLVCHPSELHLLMIQYVWNVY